MEPDKPEPPHEDSKRCGHGRCCCSLKVIGAIVLILLGWMVGYLMGGGRLCHKGKEMCSMSAMSCPMMPPAHEEQAPPKK